MRINNTVSISKLPANRQQSGSKINLREQGKYFSNDRQVTFGMKFPQYKLKTGIEIISEFFNKSISKFSQKVKNTDSSKTLKEAVVDTIKPKTTEPPTTLIKKTEEVLEETLEDAKPVESTKVQKPISLKNPQLAELIYHINHNPRNRNPVKYYEKDPIWDELDKIQETFSSFLNKKSDKIKMNALSSKLNNGKSLKQYVLETEVADFKMNSITTSIHSIGERDTRKTLISRIEEGDTRKTLKSRIGESAIQKAIRRRIGKSISQVFDLANSIENPQLKSKELKSLLDLVHNGTFHRIDPKSGEKILNLAIENSPESLIKLNFSYIKHKISQETGSKLLELAEGKRMAFLENIKQDKSAFTEFVSSELKGDDPNFLNYLDKTVAEQVLDGITKDFTPEKQLQIDIPDNLSNYKKVNYKLLKKLYGEKSDKIFKLNLPKKLVNSDQFIDFSKEMTKDEGLSFADRLDFLSKNRIKTLGVENNEKELTTLIKDLRLSHPEELTFSKLPLDEKISKINAFTNNKQYDEIRNSIEELSLTGSDKDKKELILQSVGGLIKDFTFDDSVHKTKAIMEYSKLLDSIKNTDIKIDTVKQFINKSSFCLNDEKIAKKIFTLAIEYKQENVFDGFELSTNLRFKSPQMISLMNDLMDGLTTPSEKTRFISSTLKKYGSNEPLSTNSLLSRFDEKNAKKLLDIMIENTPEHLYNLKLPPTLSKQENKFYDALNKYIKEIKTKGEAEKILDYYIGKITMRSDNQDEFWELATTPFEKLVDTQDAIKKLAAKNTQLAENIIDLILNFRKKDISFCKIPSNLRNSEIAIQESIRIIDKFFPGPSDTSKNFIWGYIRSTEDLLIHNDMMSNLDERQYKTFLNWVLDWVEDGSFYLEKPIQIWDYNSNVNNQMLEQVKEALREGTIHR